MKTGRLLTFVIYLSAFLVFHAGGVPGSPVSHSEIMDKASIAMSRGQPGAAQENNLYGGYYSGYRNYR